MRGFSESLSRGHTPGIDEAALDVPASLVHSETSRAHRSRKL